jgi:CHAT domain-containing protein
MLSWVGPLALAIAAAHTASSPPDTVALGGQLARALAGDDAAAVTALTVPGGTPTPEWARSFGWLLETYDRFEVSRCGGVADEVGAERSHFVVVEVMATASPVGQPTRRVAVPRWWSLQLVPTAIGWRIASAMMREERLAIALRDAPPAAREAAFDLPFVDPSTLFRAFAYAGDGEAGVALDHWVIELARRRGDLVREATALRAMASKEANLGRRDDALAHAQEALAVARRTGSPAEIAGAWFAVGIARWFHDDTAAAVEALLTAAAAALGDEDPTRGFRSLYMAAHIQASAGHLREALEIGEQMRRRLARFPLARPGVDLEFLVAEVYNQLGDARQAREAYERAYAGSRALGDESIVQMALADLAEFETDPAILRRLLADAARGPQPALNLSVIHARLASLLRKGGEWATADAELQESLRLARGVGERRAEAQALVDLAELRLDEHRPEEALAFATDAATLAESPEGQTRVVGPIAPWTARTTEGRALRALGRHPQAAHSLELAIAQIEEREASAPDSGFTRAGFLDDKTAPYRELADLQVEEGDPAAALATVERMRARALRGILARGHLDLFSSLSADERAEAARLNAKVLELNRAILAAGDDPTQRRLREEREQARLGWGRFTTMLSAAHPDSQRRRAGIEGAVAGQNTIPSRGLVLEYLVDTERTLVLVAGHRDDGEVFVEAVRLAVGRKELEQQVNELVGVVSGNDPGFAKHARSLYDLLLAPVRHYFVGVDRLCIVPDDILWNVPFQALLAADGQPLAASIASFLAPSLGMVAAAGAADAESSTGSRLLALGNPTLANAAARVRAQQRGIDLGPLPEAEREVHDIARLYGRQSDVWVKDAASEDRFKAAAPRYGVLHVASHGLIDDANPMFSALVLAASRGRSADGQSDDGLLEAREIADLQLSARLAVLSACDTGRGHIGNGEGLVGLAWAFLASGVPQLVVSKWKTDSEATAELMVLFHRELLAGRSAAEALRQAERALAQRPQFAHPYYWAAFAVVGTRW